jgi:hypothetical protein
MPTNDIDADFQPLRAAPDMRTAMDCLARLPADKIDGLHESLRSDHPPQGETFASIAAARESIADKLEAREP